MLEMNDIQDKLEFFFKHYASTNRGKVRLIEAYSYICIDYL